MPSLFFINNVSLTVLFLDNPPHFRRLAPNLKAVSIYGYAGTEFAKDVKEAGFVDVLHKAFETEIFAHVFCRALDRK